MKINNIIIYSTTLYIHFLFLGLILFFFSTAKLNAKAFEVENIEISKPFEINFDKNEIIDQGFKKAFSKLILLLVNTTDQKKIKEVQLNEIKGMIESFSIREEKFIDDIYYVNLGVSFNKKNIFNFLEKKNIFPAIPNKKKFLFIPIIIDENTKDLNLFSKNKIFKEWNTLVQDYHLIEYILPTEDLEDIKLIKSNYELIEKYNFKEITDKYFLKDSIIALIFINKDEVRILSRITVNEDVILKNLSFKNVDIDNTKNLESIINQLKNFYEDYWKKTNQINTSIKLPLTIQINMLDKLKITQLEKTLFETDLIYDFHILKLNKNFIFYEIIFNGSPNIFLKLMRDRGLEFDTQNKVWIVK